ncbi:YfhO family protein [Olegusella massiliensis]|uniref:YfhO family protein n=1 Tax=Olegusella massiliensis TaxID=1776381 RepID=UPI0008393F44|nr:YfhO family protein [Olegusella massiliensis]
MIKIKKLSDFNLRELCLISAIVSAVLLGIAFKLSDLYPFGDRLLLSWDSRLQYKDYFSYLWDVLHGNASISYSFGKSFGGRMIGIFSYYLSSISSVFLFFIQKEQIPQALSFVYLLKTMACSITAAIYIKKRYPSIENIFTILLSISYALMKYNAANCRNIMWLDGVVFIPLVFLGTYYCLNNRKNWLLSVFVACAILSNWYTGYMVCIAAGIYSLYELILSDNSAKDNFRSFGRFTIYMLIGCGISAIILLPSCLSLLGGKASGLYLNFFTTERNMRILKVFAGFALDAPFNQQGASILYIGGVVLVLVIYSFFSKITIKNKFANFFLLLLLFVSYHTKEGELVWTAFVRSYSYYFRFAFVSGAILLVIAANVAETLSHTPRRARATGFTASAVVIFVFTYLLASEGLFHSVYIAKIYLGLLSVYILLFIFANRYICNTFLFPLLCLELTCGTYFGLGGFPAGSFPETVGKYRDYYVSTNNLMDEIKGLDSSFYRIEKAYSYLDGTNISNVATGESFIFGYNSLEHYSSTYDATSDQFMANVGYSDYPLLQVNPTDTYWNDSLPLMETLLDVKYVAYWRDLYGYKKLKLKNNSEIPSGWSVYENNRVLPLAYAIDGTDLDITYTEDPFKNQNLIVSVMLGQKTRVYQKARITQTGQGEDESYDIAADAGAYYLYVDGRDVHRNLRQGDCEIYVNGTLLQPVCNRFFINAVSLGEYKTGDVIHVLIKHHKKDETKSHTIYAYRIDESVYNQAFFTLKNNIPESTKVDGNEVYVSTEYTEPKTLFFSIPVDVGWNCYIDGVKTKLETFGKTFICVPLTSGHHDIKMVYHTPGLAAGAVISGISLALLIILSFFKYQRKIKDKTKSKHAKGYFKNSYRSVDMSDKYPSVTSDSLLP